MATALNAIGIIEILGSIIAAIISGNTARSLLTPIVIMAGGIVCGILFCAAGRVIELLENMVSNQNKIIANFIPESEEISEEEQMLNSTGEDSMAEKTTD